MSRQPLIARATGLRAGMRGAFTLLELMLAIMLVVVIAAILSSTLAIGFKARSVGETTVETMRSGELVMESLRADLQSALPPPTAGSAHKFAGPFEGLSQPIDPNMDDLVFTGTAPSPYHPEGSNGEIKQFELTAYQPPGANDHVLVRRTFNNLLSPNAPSPGTSAQSTLPPGQYDEEILCRNVSAFNLQYYDGTQWQPLWDSTQAQNNNSLPLAVMVTLTLGSSEKDAAGQPKMVTYTRVFQFPCSTLAGSGTGSTTSSGTGGASAAKNTPPAAKSGGTK